VFVRFSDELNNSGAKPYIIFLVLKMLMLYIMPAVVLYVQVIFYLTIFYLTQAQMKIVNLPLYSFCMILNNESLKFR